MNDYEAESQRTRERLAELLDLESFAKTLKKGAIESLNNDGPPRMSIYKRWPLRRRDRELVRGIGAPQVLEEIRVVLSGYLTEYDKIAVFGIGWVLPWGFLPLRVEVHLRIEGYY